MKKYSVKILIFAVLALSPLLYYQYREYLPAYNRRPMVYELLFLGPYLLFLVTAFLGIKLNQSRLFFTAVLWAIIYYLMDRPPAEYIDSALQQVELLKLLALAIPLILLLLYAYSEKYILSLWGMLRLFSVTVPLTVSIWLAPKALSVDWPSLLGQPLFDFNFWQLPDLLWLLLAGLLTFLIWQKDSSVHYFKYAVYLNIMPLILSLNFAAGRGQLDIESRIFNLFSFALMGSIFLYALYRMYWEKVYIDELTAVPNRRAFDEYLKKLGRRYVIAMMDIDHFKSFNDSYGHTEGDNVLRFVARHIADEAGAAVFRYGGEEFAAIYRNKPVKYAFRLLDKMRANLASTEFYLRTSEEVRKSQTKKNRSKNHAKAKKVQVTISVGIAQKTAAKKEAEDVIITADKALYKSKENGRNRCEKIMS